MVMATDMDTTRTTRATRSPRANEPKWPTVLWIYLALQGAIVAISASGVDGYGVRFDPFTVAIWIILVMGVAVGRRVAWFLLSGWTMLLFLFMLIWSSSRSYEIAPVVISAILAAQAALLLTPWARTRH
jgi:hypothetical protein